MPPAGHLPVPESGGDGPAAAVPAAALAALEATPPLQDTPVKTINQSSEAAEAASEDVPPSGRVVVPPAPSTPPQSPEIPPSSQYPQQDVQVLLPHTIGGAAEVNTPHTASPVEPSEAEPEEDVQQSCSPSPPSADDGSPDLLKTPEKSPVQDSRTILEPEETSEPADTQVTTNTETLRRS